MPIPDRFANPVNIQEYLEAAIAESTVGNFEVVFTRLATPATNNDGDLVDTGVVYDGNYEYLVIAGVSNAGTPVPIVAATASVVETHNKTNVSYKPDGSTEIITHPTHDNAGDIVNSHQDISTINAAGFTLKGVPTSLVLKCDGHFYTKWDAHGGSLDGCWAIARRKRFG
jgi:hypothetical protein